MKPPRRTRWFRTSRCRQGRHRGEGHECTLLISAERRSQRLLGGQPAKSEATSNGSEAPFQAEKGRGPLLSESRYGTWSRSFRFPVAIEREQLQAVYRDGLLTVTSP